MTAVHVFSGYGYYPESGLGDYVTSFYGEDARESGIERAKEYKAQHKTDWYAVLVDEGNGLERLEENWS